MSSLVFPRWVPAAPRSRFWKALKQTAVSEPFFSPKQLLKCLSTIKPSRTWQRTHWVQSMQTIISWLPARWECRPNNPPLTVHWSSWLRKTISPKWFSTASDTQALHTSSSWTAAISKPCRAIPVMHRLRWSPSSTHTFWMMIGVWTHNDSTISSISIMVQSLKPSLAQSNPLPKPVQSIQMR